MNEYVQTALENLKDLFVSRDFDSGIRRCRELGVDLIEFDINAIYVPEDHIFESDSAYFLTNASVTFFAFGKGKKQLEFSAHYRSDQSPNLYCDVPVRRGKYATGWPEGEPLGENAIMHFLKNKFSQEIMKTLSVRNLQSRPRNIKLRRSSAYEHREEAAAYPWMD